MKPKQKLVIIGGGAAGFFSGNTAAEINPDLEVIILEQGNDVLGKVKISGGGRCNVTHACYDLKELIKYYPRGNKELLSAFYRFNCEHTIEWFESKGVGLKTEADGRIFPVSDDSQTIVDCLVEQAMRLGIKIFRQHKVLHIEKKGKLFEIQNVQQKISSDFLLIASGGSAIIWNIIKEMGHTITEPVPSLFSFNTKNTLFKDLAGISIANTNISIKNTAFTASGILLITHTGLSGPGILKISAFAARYLAELQYNFSIMINWTNKSKTEVLEALNVIKLEHPKKAIHNYSPFGLANRFWKNGLIAMKIEETKQWANLSKTEIQHIADFLTACEIPIHGKRTNKDEFVTAGGINLKEVDFKTMESKLIPDLYFAGEVLDIDAVTGGFNFQAAWTTGFIAGESIAAKSE